jgi:light-regulated signal transduction histidine kinase (bacteriophytochrome)
MKKTLPIVRWLRRKNEELSQAYSDLESLSYSVLHDLRAPFRSIGGYSTALGEDYKTRLDENGRQALAVIRKNVNKMNHLIDDLLKFSKLAKRIWSCLNCTWRNSLKISSMK